jgi:hypothetical protein
VASIDRFHSVSRDSSLLLSGRTTGSTVSVVRLTAPCFDKCLKQQGCS